MTNFISELKLKLDESTALCAKLSRENIDLQLENEELKELTNQKTKQILSLVNALEDFEKRITKVENDVNKKEAERRRSLH